MFDWLRKLFGEGKIRFELETLDGRTILGKMGFIGSPESERELAVEIANNAFIENGIHAIRVKILGIIGFGVPFELTHRWIGVRKR